jgi:hypothetical protein
LTTAAYLVSRPTPIDPHRVRLLSAKISHNSLSKAKTPFFST